jgi:hypothetical protein
MAPNGSRPSIQQSSALALAEVEANVASHVSIFRQKKGESNQQSLMDRDGKNLPSSATYDAFLSRNKQLNPDDRDRRIRRNAGSLLIHQSTRHHIHFLSRPQIDCGSTKFRRYCHVHCDYRRGLDW